MFFDDDELLMILIDEILRFVNIKIACNDIIYLSTIYWFVTIEKLFQLILCVINIFIQIIINIFIQYSMIKGNVWKI